MKESCKNEIESKEGMQFSSNLNSQYKFENFAAGESNSLAKSVVMEIAKNPSQKYNPLFIYGASGLGKTHLLQAIGNYIITKNPKLKVKYIRTENFTNELINNIRRGGDINARMSEFREKYREVDVLLLDDIQFIESKERTLEEILHTFDSLQNNNKQIVITSNRPPKQSFLSEMLLNRIENGLVIELKIPDPKTVKEMITQFLKDANLTLSADIIDYLASTSINNASELKGIIKKIKVIKELGNKKITLELIQQELIPLMD